MLATMSERKVVVSMTNLLCRVREVIKIDRRT
jgi:hypothetical protein